MLNVQSNKRKALEKFVKAFTDRDLNKIIELQNQLRNHNRNATNDPVKELMKSEEALKAEGEELGVENSSTSAPKTARKSLPIHLPRLTWEHKEEQGKKLPSN